MYVFLKEAWIEQTLLNSHTIHTTSATQDTYNAQIIEITRQLPDKSFEVRVSDSRHHIAAVIVPEAFKDFEEEIALEFKEVNGSYITVDGWYYEYCHFKSRFEIFITAFTYRGGESEVYGEPVDANMSYRVKELAKSPVFSKFSVDELFISESAIVELLKDHKDVCDKYLKKELLDYNLKVEDSGKRAMICSGTSSDVYENDRVQLDIKQALDECNESLYSIQTPDSMTSSVLRKSIYNDMSTTNSSVSKKPNDDSASSEICKSTANTPERPCLDMLSNDVSTLKYHPLAGVIGDTARLSHSIPSLSCSKRKLLLLHTENLGCKSRIVHISKNLVKLGQDANLLEEIKERTAEECSGAACNKVLEASRQHGVALTGKSNSIAKLRNVLDLCSDSDM